MSNARRIVATLGALLALLAVAPQGVAAKSLVPFHATTQENITVVPCDPNFLCNSIRGSGHATHLGTISESACARSTCGACTHARSLLRRIA
jgi:hypothetical protein